MDPRSHGSYLNRAFECQIFTTNFREFLCIILVLTLLAISGVSQPQPRGFISIDCGSTSGSRDPVTGLVWETDEMFLDSARQLADADAAIPAKVNLGDDSVSSRDNAEQLKYAMAFVPGRTPHSKYCYNLNVSETNVNTTNYLVRAMFPSRRLTASTTGEELNGYGTRFYFTVDSTLVATIELDPLEPQTVELVVSSLDEFIYICLVPLEDKSSMVAISSIELRPLPQQAYARDGSGETNTQNNIAASTTTYLMTVSRLNFGGNESLPSVRYPNDIYDRLWSAAKIPESKLSEITSRRNTDIAYLSQEGRTDDSEPGAVMLSAWEGVDMASEISFTLNISAARSYRPLPTFYLQMEFFDINPGGDSDRRFVDIFLDQTDVVSDSPWGPDGMVEPNQTWYWYNYNQMFFGDSATFRIRSNGSSTLPAMVNMVTTLGQFEAVTERTAKTDALAIRVFSDTFLNIVDTAGDPCLPVPWNWLVCSLEIPPRITQINLTGKGGRGGFPTDFGSLNRLTVLDISDNSLNGSLPQSLVEIVTLRALNIDSNNLSGGLPPIEEKSLVNLQTLSLRNNTLSGDMLVLVKALGSPVSSLDLSHNKFNGSIPVEIRELGNLENLDLSYNQLQSTLPTELLFLPKLKTLNLKNNSLEGQVPDDIWRSDSNMSSKLQIVNLEGNRFTELNLTTWSETVLASGIFGVYQLEVTLLGNHIEKVTLPSQDSMDRLCPEPQLESQIPAGFILLGDNPWCRNLSQSSMTVAQRYLCRSRQSDDFCTVRPVASKGGSKTGLITGLVVSGCVVLLMACVLVFALGRMWKRMKDLHQIQEALAKDDVRPPFFKYEDLKAATKDFAQENELGKGAFGAVYKAKLPDGSFVAVKLLFPTEQNIADFLKEMVLITGIKHRHLIQLKGCCVRDKKRILVYEYAENGNLAEALWGGSTSSVLTWAQRLRICVGVAKGLCYLHEELQPKIIHRDIKSQNILLDKDWNAKIADFGLARPVEGDATQMATHIGGTLGYFSPEYATQGLLSEKLDVYSYGILVLEIVSGRRCIQSSSPVEEVYLKNWALKMYKQGCLTGIAEEPLLATVPEEEIESVLKTALACLQEDHEKRPSMSQVVNMLIGNPSDLAIDIVSELRDQQRLYNSLFDATIATADFSGKQEREDLLLHDLTLTSSSYPKGIIELSATKAR